MKRRIEVSVCLLLFLLLTACGSYSDTSAKDRSASPSSAVDDALAAGMAAEDAAKEGETPAAAEEEFYFDGEGPVITPDSGSPLAPETAAYRQSGVDDGAPAPEEKTDEALSVSEDVDIDLTILSSTMVYSEVYDMMVTPENYIGKTIRMDGYYSCYHDEGTDATYFACIIMDATACCSQGIEFELTEDYRYPEDYPEPGDTVTVQGEFDTYKEGDYTYCTLRNARFL
ncbi:MAG: hypothetical protein K5891_10285 [Lachnospiraceae bacterium]|nr:hypothetical protein [Lachnospiraceae bacterium]